VRKILKVLAKLFPFLVPVPAPVPVPVRKNYGGLVRYKFGAPPFAGNWLASEVLTGWLADISGKHVTIGVVHWRGTIGFVKRKLHQVEFL